MSRRTDADRAAYYALISDKDLRRKHYLRTNKFERFIADLPQSDRTYVRELFEARRAADKLQKEESTYDE